MSPINNAANKPLFDKAGTVPDVSGAMQDYFQAMQFDKVVKTTSGFQVVESTAPINFRGVIQPYSDRQMFLLDIGQRAWTWFTLHADPVLTLQVDDVVMYKNTPTRVMARKDYTEYGFVEYRLVQDWEGGPS